jgi:WD40 repeat protein
MDYFLERKPPFSKDYPCFCFCFGLEQMNSLSFNSNILQVISGHLGWVRSIAFDPGNEWFCTGSADRTIKVKFTLCTPETRK